MGCASSFRCRRCTRGRTQSTSGAFQDAGRGRIDLVRIERRWEDILRIVGSISTGAVRAYDVIRMLSREGRPAPPGDAVARCGWIAKTPQIRGLAGEPGCRSQIKTQANLQEGPPCPGPEDLPRQGRTALPELSRRHGGPDRRARPGPQRFARRTSLASPRAPPREHARPTLLQLSDLPAARAWDGAASAARPGRVP
jgi:hypothetical protein